MILPFRLRTGYLRLQSRQMSRREQACIAALVVLEEQQARERRRERTVWVKPWLLRLVTLGHFDTLMQELTRESLPSSPISVQPLHGSRTGSVRFQRKLAETVR